MNGHEEDIETMSEQDTKKGRITERQQKMKTDKTCKNKKTGSDRIVCTINIFHPQYLIIGRTKAHSSHLKCMRYFVCC